MTTTEQLKVAREALEKIASPEHYHQSPRIIAGDALAKISAAPQPAPRDEHGYRPPHHMQLMVLVEEYMGACDFHGGQNGERVDTAEEALCAWFEAQLIQCAAPQALEGELNKQVLENIETLSSARNLLRVQVEELRERSEKAESALEEWVHTNKVDELQRAHDRLVAQLAARPAVDLSGLQRYFEEFHDLVPHSNGDLVKWEDLQALLAQDKPAADECHHDDTVRQGAIWTYCQQCGKRWADDEGGPPKKDKPAAPAGFVKFSQEHADALSQQLAAGEGVPHHVGFHSVDDAALAVTAGDDVPLPEPDFWHQATSEDGYSADQMHAHADAVGNARATAAWNAAMEEAANAVKAKYPHWDGVIATILALKKG